MYFHFFNLFGPDFPHIQQPNLPEYVNSQLHAFWRCIKLFFRLAQANSHSQTGFNVGSVASLPLTTFVTVFATNNIRLNKTLVQAVWLWNDKDNCLKEGIELPIVYV